MRLTLHGEGHHRNLGTSTIDTLEALDVAGTSRDLLLHLGSVDHVSNVVIDLGIGVQCRVRESSDGSFGILVSTLSDQPPWGWGTIVTDCEQRR